MSDKKSGDWIEWSQHVLIEIRRLNDGQKSLTTEQRDMREVLAVNTNQLALHIAGVAAAREQNEILRRDVDQRFKNNDEELKPIKENFIQVKLLGRLALLIIGTPACIYYCLQIFKFLKG